MSQATTQKHWTWDEYIAWERLQPDKHEFVDGQARAMVGSTSRHDAICNNLRGSIWLALRGKSWRVQGPDLKVRARDNARYPDALIDCGLVSAAAVMAQEPVMIFEVLSKSTAWIDQTVKLRDYDTVASIHSYVLINQDEPRVMIYRRDQTGQLGARAAELLEGLAAALVLADPDITIPFQVLYEGVTFED